MSLYDEEQIKKEKEKNKKLNRYIISAIVITVILIIALICLIYYLIYNPNKITVYLNDKESTTLESLLDFETTEDGKTVIYAPIRDMATILGYKSNDGEYTTNFEDKNSCYIESDNEVAIFSLNSNTIYKTDKTAKESEYEYIKIDNPVIKKDEKLYVDEEGLEKGFNIYVNYNEKTKKLYIYTLDNLIARAETIAKNKKYEAMDETFANQKAVLDNMIVVISSDKNMGVINYSTGEEILGAQYDSITYIPQKSAFLIEKNGKVGIIANDGTIKISPQYDKLTLIDNEHELYLAENNGLYGVVDMNEKIIIYLEYDKIGVDITQYKQSGLKNGYILLDKLIPVQQEGKWGFFDISGKKITNLEYDNIGCISKTSKSVVSNLMVIEDYDVVVVGKNNKYTFLSLDGREVLSCVFADVYMEMSSGKTDYYMIWNDKTYDVIEYLEKAGLTSKTANE